MSQPRAVPPLVGWQGVPSASARLASRFCRSRRPHALRVASERVGGASLLTGLSAWWGMHEASGNRPDSSGNGYTLAEVGDPLGSASGLVGLAASYVADGTTLLVNSPVVSSGFFSISAWVNLADADDDYALLTQGVNKPTIIVGLSGTVFRTNSGGNSITYPDGPTPGQWTHVVAVRSATSLTKLYVNGILRITGVKSTAFGTAITVGGVTLNALVEMVGVWSRALTDGGVSVGQQARGEIALLFGGGLGLDYPFVG